PRVKAQQAGDLPGALPCQHEVAFLLQIKCEEGVHGLASSLTTGRVGGNDPSLPSPVGNCEWCNCKTSTAGRPVVSSSKLGDRMPVLRQLQELARWLLRKRFHASSTHRLLYLVGRGFHRRTDLLDGP